MTIPVVLKEVIILNIDYKKSLIRFLQNVHKEIYFGVILSMFSFIKTFYIMFLKYFFIANYTRHPWRTITIIWNPLVDYHYQRHYKLNKDCCVTMNEKGLQISSECKYFRIILDAWDAKDASIGSWGVVRAWELRHYCESHPQMKANLCDDGLGKKDGKKTEAALETLRWLLQKGATGPVRYSCILEFCRSA